MIFYEVMTRKVPYDGLTLPQLTMELHVNNELPDLSLVEDGAPDGLQTRFRLRCRFRKHCQESLHCNRHVPACVD